MIFVRSIPSPSEGEGARKMQTSLHTKRGKEQCLKNLVRNNKQHYFRFCIKISALQKKIPATLIASSDDDICTFYSFLPFRGKVRMGVIMMTYSA